MTRITLNREIALTHGEAWVISCYAVLYVLRTVKLVGWSLMLTPWRDKKDEYGHRSSNLTTPQPTGTSNGILNCVNGVYLFSDPYPLKYKS